MRRMILLAVVLAFAVFSATAGFLTIDDTWSSTLSGYQVVTTVESATAGTNAAVAFSVVSPGASYQSGGVHNGFTSTTLGANDGDSIRLTFNLALTSGGSATSLDRKLCFGLFGAGGDLLHLALDSGTRDGTAHFMNWDNDDVAGVGPGVLYRALNAVNIPPTFSGTFNLGAGAASDTVYTMALVRQADGSAIYSVSQTKTDNDWSVQYSFTQAQADALSFDSVFIGFLGGEAVNLDYAIADLSVEVYLAPEPRAIGLYFLSSP